LIGAPSGELPFDYYFQLRIDFDHHRGLREDCDESEILGKLPLRLLIDDLNGD
jgi:hypothetical protein